MLAFQADAIPDEAVWVFLICTAGYFLLAITAPVLACFKRTASLGIGFGFFTIVLSMMGAFLLLVLAWNRDPSDPGIVYNFLTIVLHEVYCVLVYPPLLLGLLAVFLGKRTERRHLASKRQDD